MPIEESVIPLEPNWVSTQSELDSLCKKWSQQTAIAVDTEFMRSTTFYPRAALFQVGDGSACFLIDPLAIDDFSSFADLLKNPNVIKVMHSCSEDIEVFQSYLSVVPEPIFDTQIAAAFAGIGFSMGYARLVQALLEVEVAKDETRSDWLQRPLSVSQMNYAAVDVAYLPVIYGLLTQKLKELNRLEWLTQDCHAVTEQAKEEPDPDLYYLKIKSGWKLSRKQLACLQMLASWRECEARARDIPRNRLIKERTLWDIAKAGPDELKSLKRIEGMPPRTVQMDGNEIIEIVGQAYRLPDEFCPQTLPRPLPRDAADSIKAVKEVQAKFSEELNIPSEILLRKKDIEFIVRSYREGNAISFPDNLQGWRLQLMENTIRESLLKSS